MKRENIGISIVKPVTSDEKRANYIKNYQCYQYNWYISSKIQNKTFSLRKERLLLT